VKRLLLPFALLFGSCATEPAAHECPTGIVCPVGLQCAAAQAVCISNSCGNAIIDPGETCDDGNIINGDGCSADCKSAEACGDGVMNADAGEVCDDGNTTDGDGCSGDCKSLETCGNGITDTAKGEVCDDGNAHAGKCSDNKVCDSNADCTTGLCMPDGCSADCKSNETCGNGIKDLGEVCDDAHAPGGCEDDCLHGVGCGNGVLDLPPSGTEQCDDGNMVDTDDCSAACMINVCGDGIIDSTGVTHHETCDPGTGGVAVETAGCNIDCTTPSCGDAKVNLHYKPDGVHGEQCDLGSGLNGDDKACTAACQINVCGDGHRNPATEDCDNGNLNGTSSTPGSCDSQCHVVACGNGVVEPGEQCDPRTTFTSPADPTQTASCDSDCTAVVCGDSVTNSAAGEVCDQGLANNGQPCTYSSTPGTTCVRCAADCHTVNNTKAAPYCGDGNTDAGHEVCDQGAANGTACPYATSCSRCNATCSALATQQGPSCGDAVVQTADNEQCDGDAHLNGGTCVTQGFGSGTLHCNASCRYDTSSCVATCGNNVAETNESCDGTDLNGATCVTLGYSAGVLACNGTCGFNTAGCTSVCGNNTAETNESCDGTDLNGATCVTLGYGGGTLACTGCAFNTSGCTSVCGNNTAETDEQCDGTDLNGATCGTLGYGGGTLSCTGCHFNVSACTSSCGNNNAETGEQCDGTDLDGASCASLGYGGGTLACNASQCTYDVTGCHSSCGNNTAETGEQCDGTDLNGATCASFGYTGGALACTGCAFNVGGCTLCTDGIMDAGETGVDCGGGCLLCAGSACTANGQCHSGSCGVTTPGLCD